MTAIAGSWIGGAANQAAMKEVFQIEPNVFGVMVAVDVLFSYLWMAVLLWMAANHERLDRKPERRHHGDHRAQRTHGASAPRA